MPALRGVEFERLKPYLRASANEHPNFSDKIKFISRINRVIPCSSKFVLDTHFSQFCYENNKLLSEVKVMQNFMHQTKESLLLQTDMYVPAAQNYEAAYSQLKKFEECQLDVDIERWDDAWKAFKRLYGHIFAETEIMPLENVLPFLDLSKSAGSLYNCKKKEYVESEKFSDYAVYYEEMSKIESPFVLTSSALKDELRQIEKVKLNKTRQIFPCSVNHFLLGAQLFYNQSARLKAHRRNIPMKIGLSRFGSEWNATMQPFKTRSGSCDGVGWDRKFIAKALMQIGEFRYKMLAGKYRTAENRNRIMNWYNQILEKFVMMPDGHIFLVEGGQTSGNYLTLDDNSVYHELQNLTAFLNITQIPIDHEDFNYHYSKWQHIVVGDDILFNVPVEHDVFMFWKNKFLQNDSLGRYVDLEELRFCGQAMKEFRGKIVPVAERNRMISSLFWCKKTCANMFESLIRALQLRTHAFFVPEVVEIIEAYYDWCMKKGSFNKSEMEVIAASYMSHKSIIKLYLSDE